jgi:hypothetical protein
MTLERTLPVDGPANGSVMKDSRSIGVRGARLHAVQSLI